MKRLFYGAAALLLSAAASAATLSPVQLLNPAGSTSGQAIVSTGPSTAPAWGNVAATALAAQAANTVLANVTGSTVSPTAFAMPSCSATNSALQYTSGTGFTCFTLMARTDSALNQFAATTSAQLAAVLLDETGSGVAVFGTSPTIGTPTINTPTISGGTINNATVGITTPLAGKFTTLQATSTITPSSTAGIVGTTTNDNANAGSVGEVISSSVASPGVSLTTSVAANVASISLTAGDWDVWGNIYPVPAGSTVILQERGTITTSTAAIGGYGDAGSYLFPITMSAGNSVTVNVGPVRLSLASTTTVYLVGQVTFSTSTCTAFGQIFARRRR